MNNTTIFLIRHGEVEYPLDNKGRKLVYGSKVPLSNEGREQIRKLGNQLLRDKSSISIIYTSPYPRAVQTADIIANILGIKTIIQVENLKDTIYSGYEGTLYEDLIAMGGNTYLNPKSDKQETIENISKRMSIIFKTIFNKAQKENITVGIVSHGDPLRILIEFLKHPKNGLPNPATMRDDDYLEKGCALKLTLDNKLRILKSIVINHTIGGKKGKF